MMGRRGEFEGVADWLPVLPLWFLPSEGMTSGLLCLYAMLLTTFRRPLLLSCIATAAAEVVVVGACALVLLHPVRPVFDVDDVLVG